MSVSYEVRKLAKRFGSTVAVADATFTVEQGTVHGVIGKNGAGKSVLMEMVAGALAPTGGELSIGGEPVDVRRWNPRSASDHGIAMIPQEPPDFPYLTVQDYLFLGDRRATHGGFVQHKVMRRWVSEIDDRLSLRVLPNDQMAGLPIEVQQLLAFGKAVFLAEARVVLLDEITASLSEERRRALMGQLRELRVDRSFTLISHRIAEILAACDRVTVMRDGTSIETLDVPATNAEELAAAIVGNVDQQVHVAPEPRLLGAAMLELRSVSSAPLLHEADLVVYEHEVLGLAGLEGSGKDELLEVLAGLRRGQGEVFVDGRPAPVRSPRQAKRAGIAYLPKKREEFATIHGLSVLENMTLPTAKRLSGGHGIVRDGALRKAAAPLVESMSIKTPSLDTNIDNLSGGNRQKVILSRLQLMRPRVYLLNEPTRGVDIATIPQLLRIVRDELTRTSAVIVTSESEEELLETCDRVLVFLKGRVVRELRRGDVDFTVGAIYRTGQGVQVS